MQIRVFLAALARSRLQYNRKYQYKRRRVDLGTKNMLENEMAQDLLGLTAEIVSAHVANNPVAMAELPGLISQVHAALSNLGKVVVEPEVKRQEPAVSIKKSITPAYIICLEDGKKLKMLKRHLKTAYNLTPEQYREKWGLPSDYPMVADDYAKRRSALAKEIGLGTKPRGTAAKAKA